MCCEDQTQHLDPSIPLIYIKKRWSEGVWAFLEARVGPVGTNMLQSVHENRLFSDNVFDRMCIPLLFRVLNLCSC